MDKFYKLEGMLDVVRHNIRIHLYDKYQEFSDVFQCFRTTTQERINPNIERCVENVQK